MHNNNMRCGSSYDPPLLGGGQDFNTVEGDCLKIMSHVRAKEVELEAEQQMETKLRADIAAKEASNEALSKKLEEVAVLHKQRDALGDEYDRLKREGASLRAQTTRWATALNNIFKAMSVDLEQLGVMGGRITADADLVRLMGVLEAKADCCLMRGCVLCMLVPAKPSDNARHNHPNKNLKLFNLKAVEF